MKWANAAADVIERDNPELWKLCYPRRILPPGGFPNPRAWSVAMWSHIQMWSHDGLSAEAHVMVVMSTMALMARRVPTYFMEPEFAEAIARTRLPSGLRLSELMWPLDSMLIALHPSFSTQHFGCEVPFISLNKLSAGNYPYAFTGIDWESLSGSGRQLVCPNDRMLIVGHAYSERSTTPTEYSGTYPLSCDISVVREAPLHDATLIERTQFGYPAHADDTPQTPQQDQALIERLFEFAAKTLLVLAATPRSVRTGDLARPSKTKHGRTVSELWNPNIIGAGYRISRSGGAGHGTHRSPRAHLRWGHLTHQVFGTIDEKFVSTDQLPKNDNGTIAWEKVSEETRLQFWQNHKLRWVEPVWVEPKQ